MEGIHSPRFWPIFLGFAASALTIGALIVLTSLLSEESKTPASTLPAERTTALFTRIDSETLERWSSLLPSLRTIPELPPEGSVALVKTSQGGSAWVIFDRAIATPLLREDSHRSLRFFPPYVSLSTVMPRGAPWVFFTSSALMLPRETLTDAIMAASLSRTDRPTGYFALAYTQSGTVLASFLTEQQKPSQQRTHVSGLLHLLLASLGEEHALALQSLATSHLQHLFGNDTSLTYDLLPLLEQPTTFHGMQYTGATLRLLVEGSVQNPEELNRHLARLHESVAQSLPRATVEKHTFARGFSMTLIRRIETPLTEEKEINGWSVRITAPPDTQETGLATAVRGTTFLLSTDPHLLTQFITETHGLPRPVEKTFIARGVLHPSVISLLPRHPFLSLLLPSPGAVAWTLEQHGSVMTLTINTIP